MKILIVLGDHQSLRSSKYFALAVRAVMEGLIEANRIFLRTHAVPSVYEAGVRWKPEPQGSLEEFADVPTVLSRGWGDCDDFAGWRIAELRNQGEDAAPRVTWLPRDARGRRLFHVLVRRGDGTIEDPSALLGMYRALDNNKRRSA